MLDPELLAYLVCPETHQDVAEAGPQQIEGLNRAISAGKISTVGGSRVSEPIDGALVRADGLVAYPVRDEIPVMLVSEGLNLRGLEQMAKAGLHG